MNLIKVENSRVKSETRVKRMNKLLPTKNSFLESEIKKEEDASGFVEYRELVVRLRECGQWSVTINHGVGKRANPMGSFFFIYFYHFMGHSSLSPELYPLCHLLFCRF